MKKKQKWDWRIRQEKLFEASKKWFTIESILVALDLDKKMRVEVNISDYIMGDVLSMECEDGKWRLVVYLLKSLNKTERNYKIHDKEMLVVIRGLENWRHLLKGAKFKFKI